MEAKTFEKGTGMGDTIENVEQNTETKKKRQRKIFTTLIMTEEVEKKVREKMEKDGYINYAELVRALIRKYAHEGEGKNEIRYQGNQ